MKRNNVPQRIYIHANFLLRQWRSGHLKPRRTKLHGYLTIRVTPGWRLLSKDNGRNWQVLSHAEYDKQI